MNLNRHEVHRLIPKVTIAYDEINDVYTVTYTSYEVSHTEVIDGNITIDIASGSLQMIKMMVSKINSLKKIGAL